MEHADLLREGNNRLKASRNPLLQNPSTPRSKSSREWHAVFESESDSGTRFTLTAVDWIRTQDLGLPTRNSEAPENLMPEQVISC